MENPKLQKSGSRQILRLLLLAFLAGSAALAQSPPGDVKARIDQIAQKEMAAHQGVGLAVGVIHDGKRSFFAYGEAVKGTGRVPNAKTLFQIGSITKTFAAAQLAAFVHQGKARLDDRLGKYLPGMHVPGYGQRQITLLDLATHTSALPRDIRPWPHKQASVSDLLTFLGSYQLTRAPGEHYDYSNLGFALLGHALARSESSNWGAAVHREIVTPLGLVDTAIELKPEQLARRAQGYGPGNNPAPLRSNQWPGMAPAGGLYSTMADMLSYLEFVMGARGTPLNELLPILLQPRHAGPKPRTQVALGWEIGPAAEGNIIWKNGKTPGFQSYIGFNPATKTGVVVLANSGLSPAAIVHAVFSYSTLATGESAINPDENAAGDLDSSD